MGKRIASMTTITPTATADTTNLAAGTFPFALQGGSSTQRFNIVEVYLGGQAGSSTPSIMLLSFDSTVGATSLSKATGLNDTVSDGSAGALSTAVTVFNNSGTLPQRDTAKHLANLSFNAFGGVVRLNWPLDQQFVGVGNTASFGEISLSAFTGGTTGLMGCHLIFEPF
jgi:hypothetical protein